jgi:2-methylcitrate dehydratase PrpD
MELTPAQTLGAWAADLSFEQLPRELVHGIRLHVLDTLAVAVAGASSDGGKAALSVAQAAGRSGEASIVGTRGRSRAALAALVNGTYAHSLDFDDTHLPSLMHPSASIVSAVLAQAEAGGAAGPEIVVALAVGYEIACRLAMAQHEASTNRSIFFERGLHATSILGTVAGAAACAKLRRLGADGIAQAIAVACSMGSGVIESNRTGGSVKQLHGGWAAHSAVMAADLVAAGLTGAPTALEGRFGLFQSLCGEEWDPTALTAEVGEEWWFFDIAFKPYPCNHFTHALVDAARVLKERGLKPSEVREVVIGTASSSLRTIGEPLDEKRAPTSPYTAKFSGPFVFATALVGGGGLGVTSADFTPEALADPERLRIAALCDVRADPACDELFPFQLPATVSVTTVDGNQLDARVMETRGSRRNPLAEHELSIKVAGAAGSQAAALEDVCGRLELLPNAGSLVRSTAAEGRRRRRVAADLAQGHQA